MSIYEVSFVFYLGFGWVLLVEEVSVVCSCWLEF